MKNYLAVFLGSPEALVAWRAMDDDARKAQEAAGMQAWGAWMNDHRDSIVDGGSPLGKTKLINKTGVSDVKNELGAWTVVKAESHEAAAAMFENHPHFTFFPGDRVEVMECLPMPTL